MKGPGNARKPSRDVTHGRGLERYNQSLKINRDERLRSRLRGMRMIPVTCVREYVGKAARWMRKLRLDHDKK